MWKLLYAYVLHFFKFNVSTGSLSLAHYLFIYCPNLNVIEFTFIISEIKVNIVTFLDFLLLVTTNVNHALQM